MRVRWDLIFFHLTFRYFECRRSQLWLRPWANMALSIWLLMTDMKLFLK
jgi:hypothetical protein